MPPRQEKEQKRGVDRLGCGNTPPTKNRTLYLNVLQKLGDRCIMCIGLRVSVRVAFQTLFAPYGAYSLTKPDQ